MHGCTMLQDACTCARPGGQAHLPHTIKPSIVQIYLMPSLATPPHSTAASTSMLLQLQCNMLSSTRIKSTGPLEMLWHYYCTS
jgi:hypothetical protein